MEEDERCINLRIVRARDLPSPLLWKPALLSFVLGTPGGKHLFRTETVSGSNPVWNEHFVVRPTSLSSTIRLQVFHSPNASEMILLGETDVLVDALLRDEVNDVRCRLTKPGLKLRRNRGELFISGNTLINATETLSSQRKSPSPSTGSESEPEVRALGFGPLPGGLPTLFMQLDPGSLPPVEPKFSALTAALNEADVSMKALSTPSSLEKAGSVMNDSESAASSDLLQATGEVISNVLGSLIHIGDVFAEAHPYAKLAWSVLSSGYKVLRAQVERDDRVRSLWYTVQDVVAFFNGVQEQPMKADYLNQVVTDVVKQIYECCQFLKRYAEHGFAGRTFRNTLSPNKDDALQLLIDSFQTLKEKLSRGVSLENWKCLRALGDDLGEIKDHLQELWLYTLIEGQATVVECDTTRGCLLGTRTKVIEDITEWIHDPSRGRVLWLSGPVGTGKSSVANTVAGLLKGLGRLGASYRFDKQVDPSAFFRQIAYQLARIDRSVKDTMLSVLTQRGEIPSAALPDQAMRIIVRPLQSVDLVGPVVIVIDALDEIRHRDTRIREDILAFFSNKDFALPDYVKILITSRDDPYIRLHLQTRGGCEALSLDDYEDTPADIRLFVKHRLSEIQALAKIEDGWPPSGADVKLAERADRQFQWAHVTCQFIADSPQSRLSLVLSAKVATHGGSRQLDALYDSVIRSAYEARDRDPNYPLEFAYVVGCIAAGKKPFRLDDLNVLLGLRDDCYNEVHLPGSEPFSMEGARQFISSIRSLFSTSSPSLGANGPLRLVHTSLFEFLTDKKRCPGFCIDLPYWNLVIAIQCVKTLNERLDVEISNSGQLRQDSMAKGLTISGALRYACQFFVRHISDLEDRHDNMLVSQMTVFLSKRLLRWIETMTALGLEWLENLEILVTSYSMPPEYKLLAQTTTVEEKLAAIASIVGESVKQLPSAGTSGDEPDGPENLSPETSILSASTYDYDPSALYEYVAPFDSRSDIFMDWSYNPESTNPRMPTRSEDVSGVEQGAQAEPMTEIDEHQMRTAQGGVQGSERTSAASPAALLAADMFVLDPSVIARGAGPSSVQEPVIEFGPEDLRHQYDSIPEGETPLRKAEVVDTEEHAQEPGSIIRMPILPPGDRSISRMQVSGESELLPLCIREMF
ncbi:hypothetical protein DENSPDRAFT_68454 [Dentipellis sp. KUC8613]|nr:hypothetical protein DENSPDRAFT_68454 [Dentipellis sp. KUC8613]